LVSILLCGKGRLKGSKGKAKGKTKKKDMEKSWWKVIKLSSALHVPAPAANMLALRDG